MLDSKAGSYRIDVYFSSNAHNRRGHAEVYLGLTNATISAINPQRFAFLLALTWMQAAAVVAAPTHSLPETVSAKIQYAEETDAGPARGAVLKLKTIGEHLYMCGTARSVGRRDGKDDWFSHTAAIPPAPTHEKEGFEDIDGFSEDDIYCVGGAGDIWRFDGKRWQKCALPTRLWLTSVCCAGDGCVYVGGLYGHVFKGRGDRWKQIHHGTMTLPFRDMVWHEDAVWCTSDYGVWALAKDQFEQAEIPSAVKICAGHLSARDGILLAAGHGGAAFHEDGQWKLILHSGEMTSAARP